MIVFLGGLVYTLSTAEGSVFMMKIMLKKKEKGKRKVGSFDILENHKNQWNNGKSNG